MKRLIISIIVIFALFQILGLVWSSKGQSPSATFTRLLKPPQYRLTNPYENGYYYLLGFTADVSLDPAKVGHEMWLETTAGQGTQEFNYDKPGRSELQIQLPIEQVLPSWSSKNPVREFRNMHAWLQTFTSHDHILLARYERWLTMPFEDMGFGQRGAPRFMDIFVAHRLYVADGFSHDTNLGLQRLKKDMQMWRNVLRDATTITTKVMAQVVITDNLRLLSTLLSQPIVDKAVLAMTPNIAPPLAAAELSFRWSLQHQFTLGVHDDHPTESLTMSEQWLTSAGHLPAQAFRQIAHPPGHSFLGSILQTRETWEMYAAYYDAMIRAGETGQSTLPTVHEITGTAIHTTVGNLISQNSFEPDWAPFYNQLRETDARLRLASLQIILRRPSPQTTVPDRLAQVGSSYYDPFSGLPMLWSPTQQKIYSVGKDRYDDGGDGSFDISVPAIISLTPAPKESQTTTPTNRTNRR